MANDAMSSIPGTGRTAIAPGAAAPGRGGARPVRDTAVGTVITAEIPAVPAVASYGVLLPDGSVWYPGSRKRLPAPFILRLLVWILAFGVFLAGVGCFVVKYHPSWLSVFRHVVSAQSASQAPGGSTTSIPRSGTSGPSTSAVALVTPQPAGLAAGTTEYSVNSPSFGVIVKTLSGHTAWLSATPSTPGNQPDGAVTQKVLQGADNTFSVSSTGDLNLFLGATVASINVYYGYKPIGSVPVPAHAPWHIFFVLKQG